MEEESTILESSLFYSCMSSAANDEANVDDAAGGGAHEFDGKDSCGDTTVVGRGADGHRNAEPASNEGATENNIVASNPSSSNSSWSVLSENERPSVRSVTFNRDRTCLIVCTSIGVRVRTLESLQLFLQNCGETDHDNNHSQSTWTHDVILQPHGATYAQLLHSTMLLAVVKPSSPRCCCLYNAKNSSSPLAELPLSAAVKRVELNRKVLAAMTVDLRLHVFHMSSGLGDNVDAMDRKALRPTLITTLNIMHPSDSPRNVTRGLEGLYAGSYFDVSPNDDDPFLVCKSFNMTAGTVRVYDPTIVQELTNVASCNASIGSGSAISTASSWDKHYDATLPSTKKVKRRIKLLSTINAHDHSVTRMLIGGGGGKGQQSTFLATVSSKGTAVRIFGLPQGDYLWEWHRGQRSCQFYSLSWNSAGDRLATYGSSGTIHVFSWNKEKQQPPELLESVGDDDAANDGGHFEKVDDNSGPRVLDGTKKGSKPLLRRIGSSIRRKAASSNAAPIKHRSFTKMKYKPSALPDANASSTSNPKLQTLVLALLDRNEREEKEDTLAVCSMEGELRQYSVQCAGRKDSMQLTRIEDVLARK